MEAIAKKEDFSVFLKTEETGDDQELLQQYKSIFNETRTVFIKTDVDNGKLLYQGNYCIGKAKEEKKDNKGQPEDIDVFLETNKLDPSKSNISDYLADTCMEQDYSVSIKAEELDIEDNEIETKLENVDILTVEGNLNIYIKNEEFEMKLETTNPFRSDQPPQSSAQIEKQAISDPNSIVAVIKNIFQCEQCPYQTEYITNYKDHNLTHKSTLGVKLCKCEICSFTTKSRASMARHTLTHKNSSEITTENKGNFDNQMENHNSPETATYKCEFCSYASNYKRSYISHMLRHKNFCEVSLAKTVYKCDICQFETNYGKPFILHNLTHKDLGDAAMYKCTLCSHQTKHKRNFRKHILLHKDSSEVTMYKCYLCPYEAKYKNYLTRHMLRHKSPSEVTMFKCQLCPYQAKRKTNLRDHSLIHENIKGCVYKCGACDFETDDKKLLRKHWKCHTNSDSNAD